MSKRTLTCVLTRLFHIFLIRQCFRRSYSILRKRIKQKRKYYILFKTNK